MLAEVRSVVTVLERRVGTMRPAERDVLARARKQVEFLSRERKEIAHEQTKPPLTPEELELALLGAHAKTMGDVVRRAMTPGATRLDLALLTEALEVDEALEQRYVARLPKVPRASLVDNLNALRLDLAALRQQHLTVVEAWSTGGDVARRSFLRALLDDQLALYDEECAMVAPSARRPARVRHVVASLRGGVDRLRALGLTAADAAVVVSAEERLVPLASDAAGPIDPKALAEELAEVRRTYAEHFTGKRRSAASRPLLESLCQRLASVVLQALDLRLTGVVTNDDPQLRAARVALMNYESELAAVRQWQSR